MYKKTEVIQEDIENNVNVDIEGECPKEFTECEDPIKCEGIMLPIFEKNFDMFKGMSPPVDKLEKFFDKLD